MLEPRCGAFPLLICNRSAGHPTFFDGHEPPRLAGMEGLSIIWGTVMHGGDGVLHPQWVPETQGFEFPRCVDDSRFIRAQSEHYQRNLLRRPL